jgi:hypothetical protein
MLPDAAWPGTSPALSPPPLARLSKAENLVSPPTGLEFISSVTHPSDLACAHLQGGPTSIRAYGAG